MRPRPNSTVTRAEPRRRNQKLRFAGCSWTAPLVGTGVLLVASVSAAPMASGASITAAPLSCAGRPATITGSAGNDLISGTGAPDVIVAGPGDDVVRGLGGNDLICGGSGADRLHGTGGVDRLNGGYGRDLVLDARGTGRDLLRGGPGDDTLRASKVERDFRGFKTLRGGQGDDLVFSADSSQADRLYGGPDSDVLVSAGFVQGESAHYPDKLAGGKGRDILRGQRGGLTDFLLTGDGDQVDVRHDPEVDPNTTYVTATRLKYQGAPGAVVVDLDAEFGRVMGSANQDTLLGLRDSVPMGVVVYGTKHADRLLGTTNGAIDQPILRGEGGDDVVRGRTGGWLIGGTGDDLLDGGDGTGFGDGGPGRDTCVNLDSAEFCEIRQ